MNNLWKFTLVLSIIGVVTLSVIFYFRNSIVFNLKGEEVSSIVVNSSFEDVGVNAYLFDKKINHYVTINSNLNINVIGEYTIQYNLKFLKKNYNLERKIYVVDKESPAINLIGNEEVNLYIGDNYVEQGVIAIDNYDGDITADVLIESNINNQKIGSYEVKYSVNDSSGNESSIVRKVNIKEKIIKKPVITNNCVKYSDNYNNNDDIIRYIKDNNYRVSVGYYNLETGSGYFYQANKIYYGASLIKTLDAIYIYDKNLVNSQTRSWVEKAISISDNDSHHNLYNYIGEGNLKKYGIALGACNTLSGTDHFGNTTVNDQIVYLKKLYELSKNNKELKSYFINDYGNYLILDNVVIMHKYGYWGSYYHDVGIVFDEQPYIIVVLTEHGTDSFKKKKEIINHISKLIYDYHKNNK